MKISKKEDTQKKNRNTKIKKKYQGNMNPKYQIDLRQLKRIAKKPLKSRNKYRRKKTSFSTRREENQYQ